MTSLAFALIARDDSTALCLRNDSICIRLVSSCLKKQIRVCTDYAVLRLLILLASVNHKPAVTLKGLSGGECCKNPHCETIRRICA